MDKTKIAMELQTAKKVVFLNENQIKVFLGTDSQMVETVAILFLTSKDVAGQF